MYNDLMTDKRNEKKNIHVQFGFVSFKLFFEHNNLLFMNFYYHYLLFIYAEPHRDTIFVTSTSKKFMFQ